MERGRRMGYIIKKEKRGREILYNGKIYSTEEEAEEVLLRLSDEEWYIEEVND